jgi:hypothetical protein
MVEGSTRNSSAMAVKQLTARGGKGSAGKGRAVTGSVIRASIPYVKADVPVLVLFRALGTVVSCAGCLFCCRRVVFACRAGAVQGAGLSGKLQWCFVLCCTVWGGW